MAENLDACIEKACRVFGVTKLFLEQEKALKAFIDKNDVLRYLPMRFSVPDGALVHEGLSTCDDGNFAANPWIHRRSDFRIT